jgi:hypothetical protein
VDPFNKGVRFSQSTATILPYSLQLCFSQILYSRFEGKGKRIWWCFDHLLRVRRPLWLPYFHTFLQSIRIHDIPRLPKKYYSLRSKLSPFDFWIHPFCCV